MKFLDRLGLVLFSIIILVLAVVTVVVSLEWLDINDVVYALNNYILSSEMPRRIAIIIAAVLGLYAIKCIFFNSFSKNSDSRRENILLESENGKLLVSKDTIENITNTVVKKYDTAENVITRVNIEDSHNVSVYITLFVEPDTVIKDLAARVQTDVKAAVKNSVDLDLKSVNIKIKNIVNKKEKVVKQQDVQ